MLFKGNVDVFAEFHVLEHSLELGGEACAALGLELRQHRFLTVHAGRFANQQSFGQIFLVECFENVFAVNESEQKGVRIV